MINMSEIDERNHCLLSLLLTFSLSSLKKAITLPHSFGMKTYMKAALNTKLVILIRSMISKVGSRYKAT